MPFAELLNSCFRNCKKHALYFLRISTPKLDAGKSVEIFAKKSALCLAFQLLFIRPYRKIVAKLQSTLDVASGPGAVRQRRKIICSRIFLRKLKL